MEPETPPKNKKRYFEPSPGIPRWNVPLLARAKHLYALGYKNYQIQEIIDQEFGDVNLNPITVVSIEKMIKENQQEFDDFRQHLTDQCYMQVREQTANLFLSFQSTELSIVQSYSTKVTQAVTELNSLDPSERDSETGNFKNTNRIFILIELIEKLHSKASKIVGTEALREIEIYKQKMEIAQANKAPGDSLLPARGREVKEGEEVSQTRWL